MSDPQKYERDYSFTDYQAGNPSAPLPGIQVDNELENVAQSIDEIVDAIKDVRRSDGKLKNGIVTVDSLDPTVAAGVGTGALASAEAAAASADAASDSAVAAAASATAASGSATAASGYASNALTSRNAASGFADDSAAAASLSQTARDYAHEWATAAENVDVNDGVNPVGKSAYHWAQVALDAAAGSIPDGSVTTAKLADGALSADSTGRAKMADGFVTSAKIADGAIATGDLADGVLSADATGRAKMADAYLTGAKLASDVVAMFAAKLDKASVGSIAGFRDKLINGDGQVNQRSYTTVADDVYWCDRHYVLTQTAAITPTILTDVANGLPFMMRLSQSQASAQRMGNAQIVEAQVSKRLRGKQVTLGGKLRCSASQVIRYAVLEWTGTADAPTSDVVASWTNGAFTAGNFFLGSNLTVAAVGTITPTAATITDWTLTATISGSCNNLIVMMWTEGTAAQNVTLDMAWGLVVGDVTAEIWPYAARHPEQELALCQRYYEIGDITTSGYRYGNSATTYNACDVGYAVAKRSTPTVAFAGLGYVGCSGATLGVSSRSGMSVYVNTSSAGVYQVSSGTFTSDAEL